MSSQSVRNGWLRYVCELLASEDRGLASRYYAEFPDEIDAEITENDDAAERGLAAWEAERRLLSG